MPIQLRWHYSQGLALPPGYVEQPVQLVIGKGKIQERVGGGGHGSHPGRGIVSIRGIIQDCTVGAGDRGGREPFPVRIIGERGITPGFSLPAGRSCDSRRLLVSWADYDNSEGREACRQKK